MPKIRRSNLPPAVVSHIVRRVRERQITTSHLLLLSNWLSGEPTVPEGRWFKRFPNFTLCGEGEPVKTFLLPGQLPDGKEIL